jgi:hypothetical protein
LEEKIIDNYVLTTLWLSCYSGYGIETFREKLMNNPLIQIDEIKLQHLHDHLTDYMFNEDPDEIKDIFMGIINFPNEKVQNMFMDLALNINDSFRFQVDNETIFYTKDNLIELINSVEEIEIGDEVMSLDDLKKVLKNKEVVKAIQKVNKD